MEEKELIKRIRKSFKKKLSRSEITKKLQKRGYKIEYIDKLISKARQPQKIIVITAILISILIINLISVYVGLHKLDNTNESNQEYVLQEKIKHTNIETLDITLSTTQTQFTTINEQFITSLLTSLDISSKLHKHPLTQEPSIINFQIDNQAFYSEIKKTTQTYQGKSKKADITITSTKKIIHDTEISSDPTQTLKDSINEGTTSIQMQAGEAELFAKGYLSFYNSLK